MSTASDLSDSLKVLRLRLREAEDGMVALYDPQGREFGGACRAYEPSEPAGHPVTTDYFARAHLESQELQNLCQQAQQALSQAVVEVSALTDTGGVHTPMPEWFQSLHGAVSALVEGVKEAHPKAESTFEASETAD